MPPMTNLDKFRNTILHCMNDHAKAGKSIGLADPDTIYKLIKSLRHDPSQWFSAGMQLRDVGFITQYHYDCLQGKKEYDPAKDDA